jgi:hypothetical protein
LNWSEWENSIRGNQDLLAAEIRQPARRRDDNIYTAGNIGKEWKKYKSLRGREASVEVKDWKGRIGKDGLERIYLQWKGLKEMIGKEELERMYWKGCIDRLKGMIGKEELERNDLKGCLRKEKLKRND